MASKLSWFKKRQDAGFSLPELLVSIGIILLITTILLFRYNTFNNTTLLNNQAYELALDIRQAQVSGISTQRSGTNEFDEEYGIHLTMGDPQQYIFFRDIGTADTPVYNEGEEIEIFRLDSRFKIEALCLNSSTLDCSDVNTVTSLHLTFRRPNFDALIRSNATVGNKATIVLSSLSNPDFTRTVVVTPTQISVE